MSIGSTASVRVVIRHLPPLIDKGEIQSKVNDLCQAKYKHFSFSPGKLSEKSLRHARAYVQFNDLEGVFDFQSKLEGHIFVDDKGQHYRCSIEFAPLQKVPKKVLVKDPRENTLDADPDFSRFCEELHKLPPVLPMNSFESSRGGDMQMQKSSALMDFLEAKWSKANDDNDNHEKSKVDGKRQSQPVTCESSNSLLHDQRHAAKALKSSSQKNGGDLRANKLKVTHSEQKNKTEGKFLKEVKPSDVIKPGCIVKDAVKKNNGVEIASSREGVLASQAPFKKATYRKERDKSIKTQKTVKIKAGYQPYAPKSRSMKEEQEM